MGRMIPTVAFTVAADMAGAVYEFILDETERRRAARTPARSTADLDQRDRHLGARVYLLGGGEHPGRGA